VHAHRTLIAFGTAAIAAGTIGSFPSPTHAKAAPAQQIGFGTPTVMDPIHTYGEPNVGINPADGSVYDSGPEGTGTQRSGWEGSVDGGATFRIVGQCPAPSLTTTVSTDSCPLTLPPNSAASQWNVETAPGGGDAEQKFDHNGKQYFADLYALACQRVATTTDDGATAPESALGCGNTAPTCSGTPTNPTPCPGEGSDRQWLSVIDPGLIGATTVPNPAAPPAGFTPYTGPYPLVYMEYNNLQTVQNNCSTWLMSGNPGNTSGIGLSYQPANNTTTGNFGCDGYPSADQETGQVLEASSCSAGASGHGVCLNIGTPDSTGFLHFRDDSGGPGLITVASNLTDDAANLFVVSSIDSAQNLHVSWGEDPSSSTAAPTNADDWQMFTTVASAASGWTNWATPVRVSHAPSNINIFPWVVAGDGPLCQTSSSARIACAGRSDTTWYGTSDNAEGPSGTTPGNQVWDVYMAQVVWPVNATTGAYTGGAPLSNTMVKATPHPMQFGPICLLGTGCITAQGNRNVADFFEVSVDHNGAAVISYDDNSNNLLQSGAPSNVQAADHAGAGVITMARQTTGLGLLGTSVPAACSGPSPCPWSLSTPNYQSSTPTTGMSDPTGDGKYPVIGGTNLPGMDLTGNALSLSNSSSTLTVTMKAADLSSAALANVFNPATGVPGSSVVTYVTRWLMPSAAGAGTCSLPAATACTMFYAMAEVTPATVGGGAPTVTFWAGRAQSIDLCSVSACFPHVVVYPDAPPGGNLLTSGTTFDQTTGTISIQLPASDVGSPTQTSLLEEVGSYSFASDHTQSAITNAQAQADDAPLEVDGVCCFNFQASQPSTGVPETPWTPALIAIGGLMLAFGIVGARRKRHASQFQPTNDR